MQGHFIYCTQLFRVNMNTASSPMGVNFCNVFIQTVFILVTKTSYDLVWKVQFVIACLGFFFTVAYSRNILLKLTFFYVYSTGI